MKRSLLHHSKGWLPWAVVVLASGLPIFAELGALPIRLWDESRLAINALEMASGKSHWLVPTFGGNPDFWNTKPPLLIWLQALSLRTFGVSEWALRLPSALAALGTGLLLVSFAARRLGRPWLGTAAACVLFSTAGYVAIHGTRTGDYDSLLTFFTTAYGLAWFSYIEEERRTQLYIAVACIAGAVLTKSVAGLLPVPALILYPLLRRKGRLLFGTVHPYLAGLGLLLLIAGYYIIRERVSPGYLAAVQANELGGRFLKTLEGHRHGFKVYFENLFTTRFFHWVAWWIIGATLGMVSQDARLRRTVIFSTLFAGVHLLAISFAGTRIEWYDLPALPYLALTAGIGIHSVITIVRGAAASQGFPVNRFIVIGLAASAFLVPYTATKEYSTSRQQHAWDAWDNNNMGLYLQSCLRKGKAPAVDVMLWDDYEANLDWYLLALKLKGIPTRQCGNLEGLAPGTRVTTHRDYFRIAFERRYRADTLKTYENIRFYVVRGPQPPDTTRCIRPPYNWWHILGRQSSDSALPRPVPARATPAARSMPPQVPAHT